MHAAKSDAHLVSATRPIEQRIATALNETGEYQGTLNARELTPILKHVLFRLVAEQKVAGFNVPIVHHVSQMQVAILNQEIQIFCEVEVQQPVNAFIRFSYSLENAPGSPKNLRLKNNQLDVEEVTRRFDFSAKTALKMMNVAKIARTELSDPAAVIQHTIPSQLAAQNFYGTVNTIEISITEQNTLWVHLIADAAKDETIAS